MDIKNSIIIRYSRSIYTLIPSPSLIWWFKWEFLHNFKTEWYICAQGAQNATNVLFNHLISCDFLRFNELMHHNFRGLFESVRCGWAVNITQICIFVPFQQVNRFECHVCVCVGLCARERKTKCSKDESIRRGPIRTHSIH